VTRDERRMPSSNILGQSLTLAAAIESARQALVATSPTPRLDAEVLVRHASGGRRADFTARADRVLTETARRTLARLVDRRRNGEPIAYLTGHREFWSLDLEVSPDTLIPRPETELLVERALARIPLTSTWSVVDLGTGCGAIALAIAHERPRSKVIATDRSEAALARARANARRLGVENIQFLTGDWFVPLGDRRVHMVVSNPPYLRADDPHLLQGDVRFEPRAALVGGPDGLEAIRHIAANARAHLGAGAWLLLEHGFDQGDDVRALLTDREYGLTHSHRDLAGHERVVEALAR
jgi:release factor glutamine methyltransferase